MDLTERQQQIADGLAKGESVKAIAADLGISPKTVYAHVDYLANRIGGSGPPLIRVRKWSFFRSRPA